MFQNQQSSNSSSSNRAVVPEAKQALRLADGRSFPIHELCEIPEMHGAKSLGLYEEDFYADMPCLTRNAFGKGQAYYLAAKVEQSGLDAIYADIADELNLPKAMKQALPKGVIATERGEAIFLQNYSGKAQQVVFEEKYTDMITGATIEGESLMPVNGVMVLVK